MHTKSTSTEHVLSLHYCRTQAWSTGEFWPQNSRGLTDPNLNLSDPNNTSTGLGGALVADMGGILSGGTGVVIPQTDTSAANFTGKYAVGGQAFASLVGFG